MIGILFNKRRNQFQEYPAIQSNLDLIYENDKYTHVRISTFM